MKKQTFLIFVIFLVFSGQVFSQQNQLSRNDSIQQDSLFAPVPTYLIPGVAAASSSWGDYDRDGDLDLLLSGGTSPGRITGIYENLLYGFRKVTNDSSVVFPGGTRTSVAWNDYDNDGDLDFALTGYFDNDERISKIYKNDDNNFTELLPNRLLNIGLSAVAWGDYDNDGDFDLVISGTDSVSNPVTKLYEYNGHYFKEVVSAKFEGVQYSSVAWGDYDNDGDLDLLIAGETNSSQPVTKLYKNIIGGFIEVQTSIANISYGEVAWGDYDNDGDLDVLVTGKSNFGVNISKIYQNTNESFVEVFENQLQGVSESSAAWGDYDNDGDLDILLSGSYKTLLYENTENGFMEKENAYLTGLYQSEVSWADVDNDNDLDILITGFDESYTARTLLYKNNSIVANTLPSAPQNLTAEVNEGEITFYWSKATDAETPQDGLSYNLYIYEKGSSDYIKSSQSFDHGDSLNGKRMVAEIGQIQWSKRGYSLAMPTDTNVVYVWSVQAIDASLTGGPFSTEIEIEIEGIETGIQESNISWNIYPNPVKNYVTIEIDKIGTGWTIEVLNAKGQTMSREFTSNSKTKIDMTSFNEGIYFIQISNGKNKFVEKLIK